MGFFAVTAASGDDGRNIFLIIFDWLISRFRPHLGWVVFLAALILALLPVSAIRTAEWVDVGRSGVTPEWAIVFGIGFTWILAARWQRWQRSAGVSGWRSTFMAGLMLFVWLLGGGLILLQLVAHWMPGPLLVVEVVSGGAWHVLPQQAGEAMASFGWRLRDWWQGVQGGGAVQDDLIFLFFVLIILWCAASLSAWLAVTYRNGLLLALPSLWLLVLALYYGSGQRLLLVAGLGVAIALHLWLDQFSLEQGWQQSDIDYSPALVLDRVFVVLGITSLILLASLVVPSLSLDVLASQTYQRLKPVYDRADRLSDRLFPELERFGRGRYGSIGGGLPNSFLLGGSPELGETPVMQVRTSLPASGGEEPGYRLYQRRATFSDYSGQGWSNPENLTYIDRPAQREWPRSSHEGRVRVIQQVRMAQPTSILLAAGEPVVPGVAYQARVRDEGDLVALWVQQGTVRRYQVISTVPGVDEEVLRRAQGQAAGGPSPVARHLALPDTITARTRELANEITADASSAYGKAAAIEAYLRDYPYDLEVPEPVDVGDVADFFLFDLQRGYCDYYATAFVVLARLSGLPTRFATGYVPGRWLPESQEWLITEAEAHSWPEVFFPEYGWIPFEPTAGRPSLERMSGAEAEEVEPIFEEETGLAYPSISWNWQMLVWLIPVVAVALLAWRLLQRGRPLGVVQDPWRGLTAWGRRIGCPVGVSETELEYGTELAAHLASVESEPERQRRLGRAIMDVSESISRVRYGPPSVRQAAEQRARDTWQMMRREIRQRWW